MVLNRLLSKFRTPPKTEVHVQAEPWYYPDDCAVLVDGEYYLIKNHKRIRFYSPRCFYSWKLPFGLATEEALADYPIVSKPVGFRNGSVVLDFSDGRMYYISSGKRRLITQPGFLEAMGIEMDDVISAANHEITIHEEGGGL